MTTHPAFFQKIPLDFRVCAVIFLTSAFLFIDSRGLPDKAVLFPTIMLVTMMVLSAYCMVRSLLKQRKTAHEKTAGTRQQPAKRPTDLKAVCVFGGMIAVYAFLTPFIGFGLASLIFLGHIRFVAPSRNQAHCAKGVPLRNPEGLSCIYLRSSPKFSR